ncbi:folliculin-interacting protein middle domain-containing protein [Phthorimaea operculella]|nr:folliculin-interacting protein middle domain-containing protein [Phthorimaea operculella]
MALLGRLLTKIKFEYGNREVQNRSCQITPEQVRLLLFKECDWRGRKLLFDSATIERVPATKHDKPNRQMDVAPCIVEVSDGFSYVYKGPAADASVLGEMIFGAVAMNYKGVSLKLHIIEEPRRLMCTKVFCVPTSRKISRVETKPSTESSGDLRHIGSKPLNVPAVKEEGVALSFSLDRGDSGFCGDQSPYSSVGSTYDYFSMFDVWDDTTQEDLFFHSPPGRKLSTSSNGSWQRRTFQNIATRFDLGHQPSSSSNLLSVPTAGTTVTSCDSQVYSNSSTSGTNESLSSAVVNLPQKKNKLGLAMLITVSDCAEMDEVRRCLEHSTQLQAIVCRIRLATLAAGAGHKFVSTLHRAACDAARWLSELLHGPRLQPVWMSLVTGDYRTANKMAETLLTDLCSVLAVGDTKDTNFFISTLLTHVLTYHLGWVTTVSPYDTLDPQNHLASQNNEAKRPYNALWAQLSDLCGSIGFPPKTARTIISGTTNLQFIDKLLRVLTYFIRSGEVIRSDFKFQETLLKETKVISVNSVNSIPTGMKKTKTVNNFSDTDLKVPSVNTQSDSVSTLVASDVSIKKSATLANFDKLSIDSETDFTDSVEVPVTSTLRRNPTLMVPLTAISDSSLSSIEEQEPEKVVFVLGDDEKLVGLKNKSNNGKAVKRSSKAHLETVNQIEVQKEISLAEEDKEKIELAEEKIENINLSKEHEKEVCQTKYQVQKLSQTEDQKKKVSEDQKESTKLVEKHEDNINLSREPTQVQNESFQKEVAKTEACSKENCVARSKESPAKCCAQTLQHSKPIKHSGFKFEFDKYPQIVTNYMKSKNLEILDRHYIGKPGNLKLQNFQFDPTVVPTIQDEKCEICDKCQQLEALLQTPTNASEMEYMNDMPRQIEPQYAKETIVEESNLNHRELSPKTFVRQRQENTIVVNVKRLESPPRVSIEAPISKLEKSEKERQKDTLIQVKKVIEFPMPCVERLPLPVKESSGFDSSLLGGLTDHYIPDLILQGTNAQPHIWEGELRRDLSITSILNKSMEPPAQAVAIVGNTNNWQVMVVGRDCGASGMSSLVGSMLDALPAMRRARVPAHQCLSFVEGKLRELCVLSKTLADMLMTTDFCDIDTLTKSLNIDVNDVPLLLAVATTHTPQVATRYGISYR